MQIYTFVFVIAFLLTMQVVKSSRHPTHSPVKPTAKPKLGPVPPLVPFPTGPFTKTAPKLKPGPATMKKSFRQEEVVLKSKILQESEPDENAGIDIRDKY